MNLSNAWYDRLKYIQMIVIPAVVTAILALNVYYDIPNQDRIVGTITVLAVLMGSLLKKQAADYEGDGDIVLTTDTTDGEVYLSLDPNVHPASFKSRQNVTFNVRRQDVPAA